MFMERSRIGLVLVANDDKRLPAVMAVFALKLIEEFPERSLYSVLLVAVDGIDLSPYLSLMLRHTACPTETRVGGAKGKARVSRYRNRIIVWMILT
jgi:hypothetical protein